MPPYSASAIILAGGEGNRLFPLTQFRCKPAVSFGGRYRLIDVAVSNSINSSISDIYIISQFLAPTLNNYISNAYISKASHRTQIRLLSPDATLGRKGLYEGTADAIRKNIETLLQSSSQYFIILSGDQLYTMDLNHMLSFAVEKDADLVIAALPVGKEEAKRMGVMKINPSFHIMDFFEKPKTNTLLEPFQLPAEAALSREYLGSMGIYVFKREALINLLKEDAREDFGKHLIPSQLEKGKTFAYIFDGYWEDIGTITSFYEANLRLTKNHTCLDLYNERNPIYAEHHHLPPARLINTRVSESSICDGSVLEASEIIHSMIGIRSHIKAGTKIVDSIIMGNQRYSPLADECKICTPFSIGQNCHIEKAIIDEHCIIGNNVRLINADKVKNFDDKDFFIRDGIIIIPSGTYLPDGFTI
jgi:glucose-1-phosphate adenylyltransferase